MVYIVNKINKNMIEIQVIKRDIKFNFFPIEIYVDGEKKGVIKFKKKTTIIINKGSHLFELKHKIPLFSAKKDILIDDNNIITFHNQSDKWLYLSIFNCLLVIFIILGLHVCHWIMYVMIFCPLIIGMTSDFINRKYFYVINKKSTKD